jgi:transposase-like protein
MRFYTPEAAESYVRAIKWPTGPECPRCGSTNVGTVKARRVCQCREKGCRKQFSLTTDTIREGTHLRLDQWCLAVWMIVNCRNGVSSCEIARAIDCKQQSAWHLLHRVRHVMEQTDEGMMGTKTGTVEADWTYVGGMVGHMSHARRERAKKRPYWGKAIVHAMKDRRSGTVRASVMPDASRHPIKAEFGDHLAPGARLYTDESWSYGWTGWDYQHKTVNHSQEEYVRGEVHVNGCENWFKCLRMGLKGTYVRATPEHLQAYVDESVFRFNHRKEGEWTRFDAVMRRIVGRRLTYSTLTDGAVR